MPNHLLLYFPAFNSALHCRNRGWLLYVQQFVAMFLKRVRHTMRRWPITLTQLLVPLFFTIMSLIVLKTLPGPKDSPPLRLNLEEFSQTFVSFREGPDSTGLMHNLSENYKNLFWQEQYELRNVTDISGSPNTTVDQYLAFEGKRSLATYNNKFIIAASFDREGDETRSISYFNDQAYHSPAIALSEYDRALLAYFTNNKTSLETVNHPLPRTAQDKVADQMITGAEGFTIAFNVVFGMAFLASSFVLFLIKERAVNAKHSQFVSGVHSATFWMSTFCWDMINFAVPVILLLITFLGFDVKAYIEGEHLAHVFLLFLLFGWAVLPFMYLLSFIFTVPSTGFVWLSFWNILSGENTSGGPQSHT